jgi:aldehyde dehydrogenase (NAD+)
MAKKFMNFIAGEWVEPTTGDYFENRNPADQSDLIGHWPRSGKEDVERAVRSAE